MLYMNTYDLSYARRRFEQTAPNRYALALVVTRLAEWADANGDGWVYWPKPARAARLAMEQIVSTTNRDNAWQEEHDVRALDLPRLTGPIRAFLTRQRATAADVDYILSPLCN